MMKFRVREINNLDLLSDRINNDVPLFKITVMNAFSMDSQ